MKMSLFVFLKKGRTDEEMKNIAYKLVADNIGEGHWYFKTHFIEEPHPSFYNKDPYQEKANQNEFNFLPFILEDEIITEENAKNYYQVEVIVRFH